MLRWFYVALHLLVEAGAARRDAQIRFLMAQVEILRRKLGGNRVIPSPDDRARLLAIGQELDHNVADVIGIVTPQTYSRWVAELRQGRRPKRVGSPKIARNLRELVVRLAEENAGWGYRRIVGELRKLRLKLGRSSVRRILKDAGPPGESWGDHLAEVHPASCQHARRLRLLHQERDHAAGCASRLQSRVHPYRHAEGLSEPAHVSSARSVGPATRPKPHDVA